jgi:hypothetical protein
VSALPPPLLPTPVVDQALTGLPRWQRQGQTLKLTATFPKFPNFVEAMGFPPLGICPQGHQQGHQLLGKRIGGSKNGHRQDQPELSEPHLHQQFAPARPSHPIGFGFVTMA